MSEGPNPVAVLIGLFLLFAGICLVVLGGGCAISVLSERRGAREFTDLALIISVIMVAVGGLITWGGVRLLKPRDE